MPAHRSSLTFRPLGDPGRQRFLTSDDLPAVYGSSEAGPDSTFRWERRGGGGPGAALTVSMVGGGRCLVVLGLGMVDRFLTVPAAPGGVSVTMHGVGVAVPRGVVLPRARGFAALLGVVDLDRLQAADLWRPVPRWRDDPLGVRLGDRVERLLDAAVDLVLADSGGGPVGLRHLGNLMLLHAAVMSGGVGMVRTEHPPRFAEAGAAGAAFLGLVDLAAVIGRIHADPHPEPEWRLVARYWVASGPFGDDGARIRAAVARRLDGSPERSKAEFGDVACLDEPSP